MNPEKAPSTHSSSGSDAAKGHAQHRETVAVAATQPPIYNEGVDTSGVDERALVRKLDRRLIPWLSFLYLLSFLDRTSIGNAKVCCTPLYTTNVPLKSFVGKLYGLAKDIHISNDQYNIGLMIFFFSYAVFEAGLFRALTIFSSKLMYLASVGSLQHLPQAPSSIHLAFIAHAILGNCDGMFLLSSSQSHAKTPIHRLAKA